MFTTARKMTAALALAVSMAAPAGAATYNISTQGYNAFLDSSNRNAWYEGVSYALDGHRVSAAAGVFRLKARDVHGVVTDFLGFCLEPLEWLRLPKVYADGTPLGKTAVGQLGALMKNAMALVRDSRSAAAFQLAAWEIANEKTGQLNLWKGDFVVRQANLKTLQLSQSWLDALNTRKWALNTSVRILNAPQTQDLVTDLAPVPVPAAGVMLVGALAGIAGLRRRKARAV